MKNFFETYKNSWMKHFLKSARKKIVNFRTATVSGLLIASLFLDGAGFTAIDNFGSGVRLFDEYDEKGYEFRDKSDVKQSPEHKFLESIKNGEWSQEDYYGYFEFTTEDMELLFESVLKTNGEVDETLLPDAEMANSVHGLYHATRIYYQYYWETWCVYGADKWNPDLEVTHTDPNTGESYTEYGGYEYQDTPYDSEWDEPKTIEEWTVDGHEPINFQWGWHSGFRPNDSELNDPIEGGSVKAEYKDLPEDDEFHPYVTLDNKPRSDERDTWYTDELNPRYHVTWQPVYALAQMASAPNVAQWREHAEDDGGISIDNRIEPGTLQKIIDVFKTELVFGYDGAWDSEKSGYAQTTKEINGFKYTRDTDYTRWEDSLAGAKAYKWDTIDKKSYTVESVGNWDIQENGRELYKRRLYKIPATSLLSASNGYESWNYYGAEVIPEDKYGPDIDNTNGDINEDVKPDALVEGERQKYVFFEKSLSEPPAEGEDAVPEYIASISAFKQTNGPGPRMTNLNHHHMSNCVAYKCGGNMHAMQVTGGVYECDASLLEAAMAACVGEEWSWDKFLMILDSLPETDDIVERYEKIRDACNEARENGTTAYIKEEMTNPEDYTIDRHIWEPDTGEGKKIFVGKGDETIRSKLTNGTMIIPDSAEDWDEGEGVNMRLDVNQHYTRDELYYLFTHFTPYLVRGDSSAFVVSKMDLAEALVNMQDSYGKDFDVLGLLAIANNESDYGAYHTAKRKLNFIGWGAYDSNPSASKVFSEDTVAGGLCHNFQLIIDNYLYGNHAPAGKQNTYYKMRYNEGNHQYCTSTTWPSTNAIIYRQMLKCINRTTDERFIDPSATDEDNEALKNYQNQDWWQEYGAQYVAEQGNMFPPIQPGTGVKTSGFGWRKQPTEGATTNHRGLDIGAPEGTPIYSAVTGVVSLVQSGHKQCGNWVIVQSGEKSNIDTRYMHMSKVLCHQGQVVKAGDLLGLVGQTGVATGPHLHFAVAVNGTYVDPEPWLSVSY